MQENENGTSNRDQGVSRSGGVAPHLASPLFGSARCASSLGRQVLPSFFLRLRPYVGLRPFHQKSTRITQLSVGPCVVQLLSRRGERNLRSPPCGILTRVEPGRCRANMASKTAKARLWPWLSGHFLWAENRKIKNPGAGCRGTSLKEL